MEKEYKPMGKVEGYIKDPITGKYVVITPERVEAKVVFAERLINEYGYSRDQIQTFPEFYIQKGSTKIGPADIVVFRDSRKTFDNIYLIVETKRKDKKDGENQLKSYIDPTPAEGGVWFNGTEIAYYRVIRKPPSYTPELIEWRNIPKKGQSWEEIGKSKTGDELTPAQNLKQIFKVAYYYLYTNSNLPRAERLGGEMIRLIFCKIYDEIHNYRDLKFKAGAEELDEKVAERIKGLFEQVRKEYQDVFEQDEKLLLDAKSIAYVVSQLQNYSLLKTDKDAIGDAFEVFIGPTLRGEKGQFFTPRNLVRICVEILDPKPDEKVIDPACGSGGFLIVALEHIWKKMEEQYKHLPKERIGSMKTEVASKNFYGIDKEFDLAKVSKAYMAIVGDGRSGIFCADSLVSPNEWTPIQQEQIRLNSFDVLLTNPPFGSKIPITDKSLLEQYELGFQWKKDKKTEKWQRTDKVLDKQVPQVLFIERCLQLLRPGGRMAIVLPETYLHAVSSEHILQFLCRYKILHVIDLAHDTFRPDNNAKTVIVVLEKSEPITDYEIQFSIARTVGHDHTGRTLYKIDPTTHQRTAEIDDDIPYIIDKVKKHRESKTTPSPLLFSVRRSQINPKVLVPRYYWRDYVKELESYARENDCELVSMGELYTKGIIKAYEGHGSPDAIFKRTGEIPYVRVADIINWEVYKNPTALIPKDIYLKIKGRGVDLQVGDLLFVRRGSYRIGSVALVSPFDREVLLTKEISIFRVIKGENEFNITPYYLIYLLSSPIVQRQIDDKVLIETTLPNIADRWQELLLPISRDKSVRQAISKKVQNAFELKWKAVEEIGQMQKGTYDIGYSC
jgi:type I restriction enzyme M protein